MELQEEYSKMSINTGWTLYTYDSLAIDISYGRCDVDSEPCEIGSHAGLHQGPIENRSIVWLSTLCDLGCREFALIQACLLFRCSSKLEIECPAQAWIIDLNSWTNVFISCELLSGDVSDHVVGTKNYQQSRGEHCSIGIWFVTSRLLLFFSNELRKPRRITCCG